MARREAFAWVYMVAAHTDDHRDRTILVTQKRSDAVAAANDPEPGEVRVVYGCPVRGFRSTRDHVCGDATVLRKMDRTQGAS